MAPQHLYEKGPRRDEEQLLQIDELAGGLAVMNGCRHTPKNDDERDCDSSPLETKEE